MLGNPYGPRCGKRYGLEREKRVRARPPKRQGVAEQPSLLDSLAQLDNEDDNQINEEETWS
jgi:hypothetical protein